MKLRKLLVILIFAILAISTLTTLLPPFKVQKASAQEATWVSGYQYRKRVQINGSDGAGIGYVIRFRIYNTTGTDSGNKVYLGSKCLSTFGDVRFADANGNIMSYWIETITSSYADIWVKVNLNLNVSQYLYVYYGNLTVSAGISASSGADTFVFFDDFDSGLTQWTVGAGDFGLSNGQLILQTDADGMMVSNTKVYAPDGYSWYLRVKWATSLLSTTVFGISYQYNQLSYSARWEGTGINYKVYTSTADGANTDTPLYVLPSTTTSYHVYKFFTKETQTKFYYDDQLIHTSNLVPHNKLGFYFKEGDKTVYCDWVFLRKWVDPEPAPTIWGEEEINIPTFSLNVTVYPFTLESLAVPFKLNGTAYAAPQTLSVTQGVYMLEVIQQIVAVNSTHQANFTAWYVNGTQYSIEPNITINIGGNTTATMHYTIVEVSGGSTPPTSHGEDGSTMLPPTYPSGGYAPVHFESYNVELGIVKAGSTVNFEMRFSFDQVQIRIDRVEFQQHSEWFTLQTILPKTFSRGTDIIGTGKIQADFHAPLNTEGTFLIPYTIYASTSDGRQITAQASISVVVSKSQGVGGLGDISAKPILGNPLALGLLAVCVVWLGYYTIKAKR